ncbi:MAG: GNAT family N-acetyltransferase [Bacteroidetes bacterium]|nr:GNAT family N-acetyltransferase [Bacteroidota bacterium]
MNFTLRPWTIDDLESLIKNGNNKEIAKNMTNKFPHPYTEENGRSFIEFATTSTSSCVFAIDVNEKAVGGIGLHLQDDIHCRNAELGYWLGEAFWGKGIITKAITQMVDHGFKSFEIDRIFARPFGINLASQKVLEKAGFKLEARFEKVLFKNGEYLDEMVYAIRRSK